MDDEAELEAKFKMERWSKFIHYATITLAILSAFVCGLTWGSVEKPKQVINLPPIIITPEPPVIYPVPTREI